MEKKEPQATVHSLTNSTVDDHVPAAPRRTSSTVVRTDDWWLWEVIGVVSSAAALIGMVIFLNHFNNKEQPVWAYTYNKKTDQALHVSLNSILSILGTVARICVLIPVTKGLGQLKWVWFAEKERVLTDFDKFEAATRGLTGSAMLMWRLRGRHFAAIGALAMMLALGFDAFVQNLVTYYVAYEPNSGVGAYIGGTVTVYSAVGAWNSAVNSVDRRMKADVMASLLDVDASTKQPSYYCDTGNCTWTQYATLSVCSHCADLTPQLVKNCTFGETGPYLAADGGSCSYTLPSGLSIGGDGPYISHVVSIMNTSMEPVVYTNYTAEQRLGLVQSISAFDAIFVNDTSPVVASECVLVPCVQSLNTTVRTVDPLYSLGSSDTVNYTEMVLEVWEGFNTDETTSALVLEPPASDLHGITRGQIFNLTAASTRAIQSYISFTLDALVRCNGPDYYRYESGSTAAGASSAPDASEAIYNRALSNCGENVTDKNICAIQAIADAMTKSIRDTGFWDSNASPGQGWTSGDSLRPVSKVRVTWYWIALPVALWCLSVTMLIGTVWKTRQAGIRTWRTSPLALVFLGLGREESESVREHGLTESGLQKKAEGLRLRLHMTDDEAKLVGGYR